MANEDEVAEAARESQAGDIAANPPSAAGRAMARNSAVMATGTIASRVTGVLRDVAMTAALGFFLVSDAFSLGNSLPTIVYILVIGGALNAVFIPQLVRRMKEDSDGGQAYADRLLTLVATLLLVLSIAAVIAAPWIVDLYTPSDYPQNEFDLAVAFARLCLPQIFFYGLYAMLSQVLNSRGRFGAPMFAPIANNIVAIATFGLFIVIAGTSAAADGVLSTDQVLILGIGTTLGVMLQALILLPVMWRSGYAWRPRFDWRGAGLGKAGSLAAWTIGLVLVNQVAYVFITRLATQANVNASATDAVAAGLTTYQKAHLIFMLPHSVITVSIVTAMLPALSRIAHAGDLRQVGLGRGAHHAHGGGAHRPDRGDPHGQRRGRRGPALRLRRRDARPGRADGPHRLGLHAGPAAVHAVLRAAARLLRPRGHPDPVLDHRGLQRPPAGPRLPAVRHRASGRRPAGRRHRPGLLAVVLGGLPARVVAARAATGLHGERPHGLGDRPHLPGRGASRSASWSRCSPSSARPSPASRPSPGRSGARC